MTFALSLWSYTRNCGQCCKCWWLITHRNGEVACILLDITRDLLLENFISLGAVMQVPQGQRIDRDEYWFIDHMHWLITDPMGTHCISINGKMSSPFINNLFSYDHKGLLYMSDYIIYRQSCSVKYSSLTRMYIICRGPLFTNMVQFQSQHGYINTSFMKCGMNFLIHSRTSTVASLKFKNGYVI